MLLSAAMSNIYLELTNRFNEGKLRAVLSSGQAVVMHGLALSSKDGDWIIREDTESLEHILGALQEYGATYRLGAPLDARWMRGGWSSHFEFELLDYRVRTDFVTRPPRVGPEDLAQMWKEQESQSEFPVPTVDLRRLAILKETKRERDYSFIAEIARLLPDAREQFLWSRSPHEIIQLSQQYPDLVRQLVQQRPLLSYVAQGPDVLEEQLDAERRDLKKADAQRLATYTRASVQWLEQWPKLRRDIEGLPLLRAHQILVERAQVLPAEVI